MSSTLTSPRRLPSDPPELDLTVLTEEERRIIQSVLDRQEAEEKRDKHIISNLEKDVKRLEANIQKTEAAVEPTIMGSSQPDPDTCRICHKVKFAGGAGYTCHYCQLKSCSRCGGKLVLKMKTIWACNLCRKKQELARKTGHWYHEMNQTSHQRHDGLRRQTSMSSDTETGGRQSRDMRVTGATRRSSSAHALMETDQMDENGNHSRMHFRKSNGDVSRPMRLRGEMETTPFIIPKPKAVVSASSRQSSLESKSPVAARLTGSTPAFVHGKGDMNASQAQVAPAAAGRSQDSKQTEAFDVHPRQMPGSMASDLNRGGLLGPRTSLTPDKIHHGGSDTSSTVRECASSTSSRRSDGSRRSQDRSGRYPPENEVGRKRDVQEYHSPPSSSSNPRRDGSSECDFPHGGVAPRQAQRPNPPPRRNMPEPAARISKSGPDEHPTEAPRRANRDSPSKQPETFERNQDVPQIVHSRAGDAHIQGELGRVDRKRDAKLQDTREHNSSQESNSTNTSNKLTVPGRGNIDVQLVEGDNMKTARSRRREMALLHADSLSSDPSDCVRPPPPKPHKHRKVKNTTSTAQGKTGDFSSSEDEMRSTTSCGDDLESESIISEQAPGSGGRLYEGTSSNEISAKIKQFLAHPVEWKLSPDGKYIEGHMMLTRYLTADGKPCDKGILGLKVVGGMMTKNGVLGAFITNIKRGSVADKIGHLRIDDEVIEWNGRSLRNATTDEVNDSINEAVHEPLIELFVRRPYSRDNLPPQLMNSFPGRDPRDRRYTDGPPSLTITTPESPGLTRRLMSITHVSGKIQLKVSYDGKEEELSITVLSASELPLVDGNQPPQPYCKVCLLPDNSEASKRVTKPVSRTREPEWKQTFHYRPISSRDFRERSIEVTVWDLKKNGRSEFLGEIVIDLASTKLSTEPLWYRLRHHEETPNPVGSHKPASVSSLGTSSYGRADNRGGGNRGSSRGSGDGRYPAKPSRRSTSDTASEDMEEVESRRHRDVYGDQRVNRPPLHQVQHGDRRPSPHGRRSSREDLGPSPVPRRRHLPDVPLNPASNDRGYTQYEGRLGRERQYPHPDDAGRYRDANRSRSSDRYYGDNRVSPDDEMFMSDASEISGFSMKSTQSERPTRSRKLSEFASHMESRGAGRRQAPPTGYLPPNMPGRDNYEGSMSDSGVSSTFTDRRVNRMRMGNGGSNHQLNDGYGRHRMLRDDSNNVLHDRRAHRLNKQTSKDSTDGSVCSVSSDTSNAKKVFAHISDRIEGLKRATQGSLSSEYVHVRHGSNLSSASDSYLSSVSNSRRDSAGSMLSDIRRGSDVSTASEYLRPRSDMQSCTSLESSVYEDDLARAQMTERWHQHVPQYHHDVNSTSVLDPTTIGWAQPRNGSEGLNDFIEGLGKGQVVGRQVLGTSCLGEIQMGLSDKKGRLEVELIRARDLQTKPGAKHAPSTYVKVYLMDGKNCVEKMKTPNAERKTTEPFFKCLLTFMEPYMQKMLHVMVWGDYGRIGERKVFMGLCQVNLDDLDLTHIVFGWYKLFSTQSMAGPGACRRSSQTSIDSTASNMRYLNSKSNSNP